MPIVGMDIIGYSSPLDIRGITYPIFVTGFVVKIFIPRAMSWAKENRIVAAFRIGRVAGAFNSRDTRGQIGGDGQSGPCIGEKRVRRWYGAGCPLGETFNRLAANAFKMADSVRSSLIVAELGYGGDGRVASRDLWIPWDVLSRNCLVYRDLVLEYLEDLARNQSSGRSLPFSRRNSEWDCVFIILGRYRYKQSQKHSKYICKINIIAIYNI